MSEPNYMADLDVAFCRSRQDVEIVAAWAWWAISQLDEPLRSEAAKAWKQGKTPSEMKVAS